jgi:hypothetical protein
MPDLYRFLTASEDGKENPHSRGNFRPFKSAPSTVTTAKSSIFGGGPTQPAKKYLSREAVEIARHAGVPLERLADTRTLSDKLAAQRGEDVAPSAGRDPRLHVLTRQQPRPADLLNTVAGRRAATSGSNTSAYSPYPGTGSAVQARFDIGLAMGLSRERIAMQVLSDMTAADPETGMGTGATDTSDPVSTAYAACQKAGYSGTLTDWITEATQRAAQRGSGVSLTDYCHILAASSAEVAKFIDIAKGAGAATAQGATVTNSRPW